MGKGEGTNIPKPASESPPEDPNKTKTTGAEAEMDTNSFHYLIAEKNKVLVLSFVGGLSGKAHLEIGRCVKEIEALDFTVVVINFREVYGVDQAATGYMAQIKKVLRKKTTEIAICGVKPSVRDFLISQGVISKQEVFNNVKDALLRFTTKEKAAA